MIRGLYTSAAGMDVQQAKMESIANNLANASTPGYKKEDIKAIKSFPDILLIQQGGLQRKAGWPLPSSPPVIGTTQMGALVAGTTVDYSEGAVQETGKATDIFLKGPGFFAVNVPVQEDPARIGYTRNGAFNLDAEGYLVVNGGYRVLGEAGPVRVDSADFKVASDGTIAAGDVEIGRLRLVEFNDLNGLQKESDGIFVDAQGTGQPAGATTVQQGFLEKSNVNVVQEMTDLVALLRTYETNQRLIQSQDELLAKAVNQVGSLR